MYKQLVQALTYTPACTHKYRADLCKHVLDGSGRGDEGRKRQEEVVARLACSVDDLDTIVYP